MRDQMHDAQDLLGGWEHVEVLARDGLPQEVLNAFADEHKRNKGNSLLARTKEDLEALKEDMLDQIAPSMINEEFYDLTTIMKTYNGIIEDVLSVPQDDSWPLVLGDFITLHRAEYKAVNKEVNALKLKVQRLMTLEIAKHTSGRPPFPDGRGASGYVSAFKLPRIQIPRFEDNVSGSVNWENFRSMMTKLPSEIDPQEKAFILKRALTGESAKLVANEQSYEQAINMLASVYWNELLQL